MNITYIFFVKHYVEFLHVDFFLQTILVFLLQSQSAIFKTYNMIIDYLLGPNY